MASHLRSQCFQNVLWKALAITINTPRADTLLASVFNAVIAVLKLAAEAREIDAL